MMIPVLPAVTVSDDILTGTLSMDGRRFISSSTSDFKTTASEISRSLERRSPILTVDVNGFNDRIVNNGLIAKTKTRRSEHWVLTGITTIDDVFDAFYMGADTLLLPYHNISPAVLKEINDISDQCIPFIVTDGMSSLSGSGPEDLIESIRNVQRCGFSEAAILNISNGDIWGDVLKENERIIPFVFEPYVIHEKGFSDVLEVLSQAHITQSQSDAHLSD